MNFNKKLFKKHYGRSAVRFFTFCIVSIIVAPLLITLLSYITKHTNYPSELLYLVDVISVFALLTPLAMTPFAAYNYVKKLVDGKCQKLFFDQYGYLNVQNNAEITSKITFIEAMRISNEEITIFGNIDVLDIRNNLIRRETQINILRCVDNEVQIIHKCPPRNLFYL